jgi:hypothetical protein
VANFIDLLKSVPDVVWSGIFASAITSAITLGGVLISNSGNASRLKLQLEHDATEKAKERTATLRREVYLQFVEELAKINAHLPSLAQADISKTNIGDGLQGFLSAAARLHLIAEPKTAILVGELSAGYSDLLFKIMPHLISISGIKSEIQSSDQLFNKAQCELNRISSEMAKFIETGRQDDQVFQDLNSSFQFQMSQMENYGNEKNQAFLRLNQLNLTFQRLLLSELRHISGRYIPILIELRRDLGFDGNLGSIEELMREQWVRMEANFDRLCSDIEKTLSEAPKH